MIFIQRTQTVALNLTTPVHMCCNCGAKNDIELVETPLVRSRYYGVYGTELSLLETYPYCPRCRASATRTPPNTAWKLLVGGGLFALLMIYFLTAGGRRFSSIGSMTAVAAMIAAGLTLAYYWWRGAAPDGRTHYQPVRLTRLRQDGDHVTQLSLAFSNRRYAREMTRSNAELIRAGVLKIES